MKLSDIFDSEAKRIAFIKRCRDSVRSTDNDNDSMCGLIRDLIPLYLDDALSEGSRALISDHLSECSACRHYLDFSRRLRTSAAGRASRHRPQGYAALAGRLKKRRLICAAACASVIAATVAYGVYSAVSSRREQRS